MCSSHNHISTSYHIYRIFRYFCILLSIHTKFEISLYYKYTTHIFSQNFYRSIRHKYIINMPRTNRRKKIPCCDAETIKQGAFFALLFMGVKYIYNDTNIINKKALKTKVKRYVREKTWSMFSSISVFLFICFVAYKTTCSVLHTGTEE